MNDRTLSRPLDEDTSVTDRIDALERDVADMRKLLADYSPKRNAKRIELNSKIITAMSHSMRMISLTIQALIKRRPHE